MTCDNLWRDKGPAKVGQEVFWSSHFEIYPQAIHDPPSARLLPKLPIQWVIGVDGQVVLEISGRLQEPDVR